MMLLFVVAHKVCWFSFFGNVIVFLLTNCDGLVFDLILLCFSLLLLTMCDGLVFGLVL